MIMLIKQLFFIITLITFVSAEPFIAILSSGDKSCKKLIQEKLPKNISSKIFTIRNTYDIGKMLLSDPSEIIITSSKTLRIVLKYSPDNFFSRRVLIIQDYDFLYNNKTQIPDNSVSIIPSMNSIDLYARISKFTETLVTKVGYIYPYNFAAKSRSEINKIEDIGVRVTPCELKREATSKVIESDIKKVIKKGNTIIRFVGNSNDCDTIYNSPKIIKELRDNVSIIITESDKLYKQFPHTAVVTIRENSDLLSSIIVNIAIAMLRTKELPKYIEVSSSIPTLHFGSSKRFTLMGNISSDITLIKDNSSSLLTVDNDSILPTLFNSIGAFVDTALDLSYMNLTIVSSRAQGLNKEAFGGISYKDLIFITISILLIILFMIIVAKILRKRSLSTPTALIYPRKKHIILNRKNKKRNLKRYFKKEKMQPVRCSKQGKFDKYLNILNIKLVVIDYQRCNKKFIKSFIKSMKNCHKSNRIKIVVYNINRNSQLELAPRLGDYLLHFHDNILTSEILDSVIYGDKGKSPMTDYISGDITSNDMLIPIFQMLDQNKDNGVLLIEDPKPFAAIFYRDGKIVYAQSVFNNTGIQAVFDVLGKLKGSFRFVKEKKAPVEDCSISSMDLLMEWANYREISNGR